VLTLGTGSQGLKFRGQSNPTFLITSQYSSKETMMSSRLAAKVDSLTVMAMA